ncbi:MAG TPA: sulfatase [Candidatus Paceibacterota bacterium]|nr:sulfatase [Candidatus Paceibacterota bacterium]
MRALFRIVRIALVAAITVGATFLTLQFARAYLSAPREALCSRCNVVLISVDTLGAKHTSVYDPALETTPFLKELADTRAVVFEHAYAQAPWGLPSHASMFTGEYPWKLGVAVPLDMLSESAFTLAEALKRKGYATAGFANGSYVQPINGLTQGIDTFVGSYALADWNDMPLMAELAGAWVNARAESGEPFFLFLRPFQPHEPYGDLGAEGTITTKEIVDTNLAPGGPTEEDIERFRKAYYRELRAVDEGLRRFFAALDASPHADDTIVIITGSNGEEFGEHGMVGVHDMGLHVEHLKVPLLIIVPRVAPARILETVEVRGIPATVMDAIGFPNNPFEGASLLPALSGSPEPNAIVLSRTAVTRDDLLTHTADSNAHADAWGVTIWPHLSGGNSREPHAASALYGRWHAIRSFDGRISLYDLETDPAERQDIFPELDRLDTADRGRVRELMASLLLDS